MTQLTDRQQAIYDFLVAYTNTHHYAPSMREIMDEFGMASTNGARTHLKALERKGYIKRQDGVGRGITLLIVDNVHVTPELWSEVKRFFENYHKFRYEEMEWRVKEMKAKLREV